MSLMTSFFIFWLIESLQTHMLAAPKRFCLPDITGLLEHGLMIRTTYSFTFRDTPIYHRISLSGFYAQKYHYFYKKILYFLQCSFYSLVIPCWISKVHFFLFCFNRSFRKASILAESRNWFHCCWLHIKMGNGIKWSSTFIFFFFSFITCQCFVVQF